jgi:hypothetical protein
MAPLLKALLTTLVVPLTLAAPTPGTTELVTSSLAPITTSIPICDDLPFNQGSSGVLCFEPIIKHAPNKEISPRFDPGRSAIIVSGLDNSKTWCAKISRAAPQPRKSDAVKLCSALPNIIAIAPNTGVDSQYENMALCKIFDQGTARYRVCNLDTCREQEFVANEKKCLDLYEACPGQGSTSGYRVGVNYKGMGFATAITGTRVMGDYPFELNDDAFLIKQFQATCSTY